VKITFSKKTKQFEHGHELLVPGQHHVGQSSNTHQNTQEYKPQVTSKIVVVMIIAGADVEMLYKTYGHSGHISRLRKSMQFRHSEIHSYTSDSHEPEVARAQ
jgi:hypothetical protein